MYVKWQEYSRTAAMTAKIINLVWTDMAANALVDTKSWISGSALPPNLSKRDGLARNDAAVLVPGTLYEHRMRHKRRFAIPAAIILFLTAVVIFNALIFTVMGKATLSRVKEYLFQLSAGRIFHQFPLFGSLQRVGADQGLDRSSR
jgi:multisubunit Na+/H+ antiporter MnhC subunit